MLPMTPQSTFNSILPSILSKMLQIAHDGSLPVYFILHP